MNKDLANELTARKKHYDIASRELKNITDLLKVHTRVVNRLTRMKNMLENEIHPQNISGVVKDFIKMIEQQTSMDKVLMVLSTYGVVVHHQLFQQNTLYPYETEHPFDTIYINKLQCMLFDKELDIIVSEYKSYKGDFLAKGSTKAERVYEDPKFKVLSIDGIDV